MSHPITIREGENLYEVAKELESKKLASAARIVELCKSPDFIKTLGWSPEWIAETPKTLEGYLFPETYGFNRTTTPEEMLRQMVRLFRAHWEPRFNARALELGLTPSQIVILASMVEKETGAPEERPLIASVFFNRLKKKMRLQSDPTTIYGMWDRYEGKIHKSDLTVTNPYNTYMIPALPIGPISNPGQKAIEAALYPADSPYFFFVSHNDGTHQFSKTFGEHENAVRKFQLDPKAREGKSWRDLKKRQVSTPEQRN
jgi:UPF0755 protein